MGSILSSHLSCSIATLNFFVSCCQSSFFLFYFRIGMSTSEQISSNESVSKDLDGLDLESLFQEEESTRCLSFDMWGSCRADNFRTKLQENQSLKPLRVHLFKLVTEYFKKMNINYFIYGGTALSVYREGGRMIKHDGDIDIAILESDFSNAVHGIDSFCAFKEGDVLMSHECSHSKRGWFDVDGKEIPFSGAVGGKRLKFFASGRLFKQFGFQADESFDLDLAHLDVFTLSQHPDDSNCYSVNWNFPGSYDYRRKAFPKSIFSPLKTYNFEGVEVYGMNDLRTYLEIEYGYLGRGAMYDCKTQLYVKIPENLFKQLPSEVQRTMNGDS